MDNELIQILLNTLEPNTTVVKDSQIKLEKSEIQPNYALCLGDIIIGSENHPKKLDLVATLALSRCIKMRYK